MSNPLVSVIIPAYNAEKFIAETLDSVFAQTYRPIEVIVIDDGSEDKTTEIVKKYQIANVETGKQGYLIYMYKENSGPSKARNTGIKSAKGEYIAFLDADDLWPRNKLEKQVKIIKENYDVALLFGNVQRLTGEGVIGESLFERRKYSEEFFGDLVYVRDAYKKLLRSNFMLTGTVILRKECLEAIGMFDEELYFAEDWDLWLRVAQKYPIGYTKEICLLRRAHEENISRAADNMELSAIKVLEKHKQNFEDFLTKEKIDLMPYYLQSYRQLGYIYFGNGRLKHAREYFQKSLKIKFHFRTLLYFLITVFKEIFLRKKKAIF